MSAIYTPTTLAEALELLANESLIPYAGGTDLMVSPDDGRAFLFLHKLPELKQFVADDQGYFIGAGLTYSELLADQRTPELLRQACGCIAAPPLRNTATIGGNVANASPKGDAALALVAADAVVHLASQSEQRQIPIADFYLGRGKTLRRPDELLTGFSIDRQWLDDFCFEKVGGRAALAISRVSFAGLFAENEGRVAHWAVAFGAVEETIVRCLDLDARLIGKTIDEARQLAAGYHADYVAALQPIRGRVSTEYRKQVCANLLADFLQQKLGAALL